MKLKHAVQKSIRRYYDGKLPEEAIKASEGEFKFTPEYFDNMLGEEADDGEEAAKEG